MSGEFEMPKQCQSLHAPEAAPSPLMQQYLDERHADGTVAATKAMGWAREEVVWGANGKALVANIEPGGVPGEPPSVRYLAMPLNDDLSQGNVGGSKMPTYWRTENYLAESQRGSATWWKQEGNDRIYLESSFGRGNNLRAQIGDVYDSQLNYKSSFKYNFTPDGNLASCAYGTLRTFAAPRQNSIEYQWKELWKKGQ